MRIQYVISDEAEEEMRNFMKICGIRTKQDFLDNAVTVFKMAVLEKTKGARILVQGDEEKTREIIMPSLEHATLRSKKKLT